METFRENSIFKVVFRNFHMTLYDMETSRMWAISERQWHECTIAVLFRYSIPFVLPYSSPHKGCTQMECPFMYPPGLQSTSFIYTTPRVYINSTSCLTLHKIGVEYWTSKIATPESAVSVQLRGQINLLFCILISHWGAHNSFIDIQESKIILLTVNYTQTNLVLWPKKNMEKITFLLHFLTSDVEENLYW